LVFFVRQAVRDESAIEFQAVDGPVAQVLQAGKSSAEIIQRHANAPAAQYRKGLVDLTLGLPHRDTFGDFNDEVPGMEVVQFQRREKSVRKLLTTQVRRRDVDRQPSGTETCRSPECAVSQGGAQHRTRQ